ncbi:prepilin-type N-terminal cleavage/methylation domain-containing protein [Candidatus Saccharibacteria bacterium]|nr:prepilin-type N-terminal cleavage/methylation domain-containing protein [Candidatus Saccharibacteria bacterium]
MHYSLKTNQCGFTIVELLIVIVVIGILAAVTIVSYNGIQQSARNKGILSDISALAGLETRYALANDNGGKAWYSGTGLDSDLQFKPSPGNVVDVVVSSKDYCIRAFNPVSSNYKTLATAAIEESSNGVCALIGPSVAVINR